MILNHLSRRFYSTHRLFGLVNLHHHTFSSRIKALEQHNFVWHLVFDIIELVFFIRRDVECFTFDFIAFGGQVRIQIWELFFPTIVVIVGIRWVSLGIE
jgi:hypothetical protein